MATSVEIISCGAGRCVNANNGYCDLSENVVDNKGRCSGSVIMSSLYRDGTWVNIMIEKCFNQACVYYREREKCNTKWAPIINKEGRCSQFLKQLIPIASTFLH